MENCNHTPSRECGCNTAPSRSMPMQSRSMPGHSTQSRSMQYRSMPGHSMQSRPMQRPCEHMKNDPLSKLPVAMAYVPWQYFEETYEPDKALQYGTIFPELNKPFYGRGGCPR